MSKVVSSIESVQHTLAGGPDQEDHYVVVLSLLTPNSPFKQGRPLDYHEMRTNQRVCPMRVEGYRPHVIDTAL